MENNTHTNGVRRVVILGGGISGLATAYYLLKKQDPGNTLQITIYETAGELGGNCRTFQLDLGIPPDKLQRWADMGVNDYNDKSYDHLSKMMEDVGYTSRPLEDTEQFYTNDLTYFYTNDEAYFTKIENADIKKG